MNANTVWETVMARNGAVVRSGSHLAHVAFIVMVTGGFSAGNNKRQQDIARNGCLVNAWYFCTSISTCLGTTKTTGWFRLSGTCSAT
jgi:hypothetical protein